MNSFQYKRFVCISPVIYALHLHNVHNRITMHVTTIQMLDVILLQTSIIIFTFLYSSFSAFCIQSLTEEISLIHCDRNKNIRSNHHADFHYHLLIMLCKNIISQSLKLFLGYKSIEYMCLLIISDVVMQYLKHRSSAFVNINSHYSSANPNKEPDTDLCITKVKYVMLIRKVSVNV